jgi:CubicO group peptidase (beta-lactamase class C family)
MHLFSSAAPPHRGARTRSSLHRAGSRGRRWAALALAVLVCTTAPAHPATADGDEPQDVVTAVDRFMAARMQTSAIPGAAVAVIRGDRVLSVRGYGHDSTGHRSPGTPCSGSPR